jgi:hypothetical protein
LAEHPRKSGRPRSRALRAVNRAVVLLELLLRLRSRGASPRGKKQTSPIGISQGATTARSLGQRAS